MAVGAQGLVLDTTESEGQAFVMPDGGITQIMCEVHAGGTWQLEHRVNDDADWAPTDADEDIFSEARTITVYAAPGMQYRLAGGTVGASFRAIPVFGQGGPILA